MWSSGDRSADGFRGPGRPTTAVIAVERRAASG